MGAADYRRAGIAVVMAFRIILARLRAAAHSISWISRHRIQTEWFGSRLFSVECCDCGQAFWPQTRVTYQRQQHRATTERSEVIEETKERF